MEKTFLPTTNLMAGQLNSEIGLGLFLPDHRYGKVRLFLVVEAAGVRSAIVLLTDDPIYEMQAWPLNEQTTSWRGLSLGQVEVLIDPTSLEVQDIGRPVAGCITISDGMAFIGARPEGQYTSAAFQVGTSAGSGPSGAAFSRWRLVQRDAKGDHIVLFERIDAAT